MFTGGSDQVELVGDGVSLLDLLSGPLGGTTRGRLRHGQPRDRKAERSCRDSPPVKGLAGVDEVVESPNGLLHGDGRVGSVSKDDVDCGSQRRGLSVLVLVMPFGPL